MATAAKEVMDAGTVVLALSPHDILVSDRLGAFWPDKAAAIGRLMAEDGQNEPIKVRKNGPRATAPWTLVAGLHRLEGAKLEGLAIIDAIVVAGDEAMLRKVEASENIERGSRSPLERASFVRAIADAAEARLKEQHGDLTPAQIAIRARWDAMKSRAPGVERDDDLNEAEADHTRLNLSRVYGWREGVAEALGMSLAAIKRDLALHRALIAPFPRLWRDLATHPVIGENASALRDIAAIKDEDMRGDLIASLIDNPDMTLAQAMEGLGLSTPAAPAATGATKYMNNATANLARLSAGEQRQIASQIVETFKPTALEALRDALNARLAEIGEEA
ncbi:ParB-like nuclease domain-containing protein [Sphingobium faniae]|nr:ParB-like nuclease domain-containing protein [Sphingobium faniae]